MTRLRPGALAAVGAIIVFCSACSGGSPASTPAAATTQPSTSAAPTPAALDAAKVGSAVTDAAKQATSVHIRGAVSEGGSTTLDLQLGQDRAAGTVTQDGIEIPVLRVGDKYYFRFTDSLVKKAGIPAAAGKQLTGKWVPSTAAVGAGIAEAFKQFLDYKTFLDNTVGQLGKATFTGGEPATVDGAAALKFTSPDGTATVAADEPHYLLRMQDPKSGAMDFSDWNKPVTATIPPKAEIYSGPGS
jgi:hypothetical protein